MSCTLADEFYHMTVDLLYKDLTYNEGSWSILGLGKDASFARSAIETVLDGYYALLIQDKNQAIFNAEKYKNQDPVQIDLMNKLKNLTGLEIAFIERVMNQLYWGSIQGRIPGNDILDPRRNPKSLEELKQREGISRFISSIGSLVSGTVETAGNIIQGAGKLVNTAANSFQYTPVLIGAGVLVIGLIALQQLRGNK